MRNPYPFGPTRRIAALIYGAVFAACAVWAQPDAAAAPTAATQLTGVWRLVRYVDTPDKAQPIYAFGEHPVGQFIFTPEGNFSISIMRNPPAPEATTVDIDPDACIPAWYCSYFGTYRLAESGKQWIARVEGGNIPSYLNTNQTRSFELSGDRLRISESYEEGGRTVRAERVLERVH